MWPPCSSGLPFGLRLFRLVECAAACVECGGLAAAFAMPNPSTQPLCEKELHR
jgi:hypothetical protein